MGLFSLFKPAQPANPGVLLLSHSFAYDGLPKILFADPAAVISALQKDGHTAVQTYVAAFLKDYVKAIPAAGPHIPRDFASMFSLEISHLDANQRALLITHPRPPNYVVELQPGKPLLAPFFTAVLWSQSNIASPNYFVLQQALPTSVVFEHGTYVRTVYADGSSGNTMKSCKPTPAAFLTLLRSTLPVICVSSGGQRAATAPATADSAVAPPLALGGEACPPSLAVSR